MMVAGKSYAQNSLVATLEHNETTTVFVGVNALSEAHNAAVNGDLITLSSGTFNACNITKAITLRGAGMELDTINHIEPTILNGDFGLTAYVDTCAVTLEGLYHDANINLTGDATLRNPLFLKCRLGSVICNFSSGNYYTTYNYWSKMANAKFVNCIITKSIPFSGTASFTNCLITDLYQHHTSMAVDITNCILIYSSFAC